MKKILFWQMTTTMILILLVGITQAHAKSCDAYDCEMQEAPEWINYPDLTPVQLDVYQDANSDNPRDILVCLTIANQGIFPVTQSREFDVYRSMNNGSEIFDQDVNEHIRGRFSYPNNKIVLMSDPRIPGTGTQPSSNTVPITYIVDYHDDIEEARETNNEITVLYSVSTAEARFDCEDSVSNAERTDGYTIDEDLERSHDVLDDDAVKKNEWSTGGATPSGFDSTVEKDGWSTGGATPSGIEIDDQRNEWWADGATPSALKDDANRNRWSTGGATPSGVTVDDQKNEWWADGATPSAYH